MIQAQKIGIKNKIKFSTINNLVFIFCEKINQFKQKLLQRKNNFNSNASKIKCAHIQRKL